MRALLPIIAVVLIAYLVIGGISRPLPRGRRPSLGLVEPAAGLSAVFLVSAAVVLFAAVIALRLAVASDDVSPEGARHANA